MKKDDFKRSVDKINPDSYFGNRLKAKITTVDVPVKNYKKITVAIASACLVFAIIAGIGAGSMPVSELDVPQNIVENIVPQKETVNAFIMIASASNTEDTEVATESNILELNEEYPYEVYLDVRDVSDLSDDEISAVVKESRNIFDKYCAEKNFYVGSAMISSTEDIVLVQCTFNDFRISLEDTENIKSVNVKNTSEYGQMVYTVNKPDFDVPENGNDITIVGSDFDFEDGRFYWEHTSEIERAFDENINIPYSTFNDTITFTVEYNDGSKAIGVVDLVFDDNGNATAVCKGYDFVSQ